MTTIKAIIDTFCYIKLALKLKISVDQETVLLRALLRHNLHTMQFTHLKCTIRCFLVYSQVCAAVTTLGSFHSHKFVEN